MYKNHKNKKHTIQSDYQIPKKSKLSEQKSLWNHATAVNAQVQKLKKYKLQLLQQRNQYRHQSFGTKNQYQKQPRSSPLLKQEINLGRRITNFSIPSQLQNKPPKQNTLKRVKSIQNIIDKLLNQSKTESSQVKNGLKSLKKIQNQVIKQLQDQQYDNNKIQQKARDTNDYEERPTFRQVQRNNNQKYYQQVREQTPKLRSPSQNQTEEQYEVIQKSETSQSGNIQYYDQIMGLDQIQTKVVSQILSLRQQKINLMKQLNQQIKHSNSLARQNKILQKQIMRLRDYIHHQNQNHQRSQSSQLETESFIAKLKRDEPDFRNSYNSNLQKIQIQNRKLKERQRRQQQISQLNRHNQRQIKRSEAEDGRKFDRNIQQLKAQKKIEKIIQQLQIQKQMINNERRAQNEQKAQMMKILIQQKNRLRQKQEQMQQLKRISAHHYDQTLSNSNLKRELQFLKQQNQQLRVNTIQLLKHQNNLKFNLKQPQNYRQDRPDRIQKTNQRQNQDKYSKNLNSLKKYQQSLKRQNYQLNREAQNIRSKYSQNYQNQYNINQQFQKKPLRSNNDQRLLKKATSETKFTKYKQILEDLKSIKRVS